MAAARRGRPRLLSGEESERTLRRRCEEAIQVDEHNRQLKLHAFLVEKPRVEAPRLEFPAPDPDTAPAPAPAPALDLAPASCESQLHPEPSLHRDVHERSARWPARMQRARREKTAEIRKASNRGGARRGAGRPPSAANRYRRTHARLSVTSRACQGPARHRPCSPRCRSGGPGRCSCLRCARGRWRSFA